MEHGIIAWHTVLGTDENLVNDGHDENFAFIDMFIEIVIDT